MGRKLFVGNLPFQTTEDELHDLFSQVDSVETVTVMRDQMTGRARGFAFVEMSSDEGAQKAIDQLNNTQLGGRTLAINEARPKAPRAGGYGRRRRRPAAVAAAATAAASRAGREGKGREEKRQGREAISPSFSLFSSHFFLLVWPQGQTKLGGTWPYEDRWAEASASASARGPNGRRRRRLAARKPSSDAPTLRDIPQARIPTSRESCRGRKPTRGETRNFLPIPIRKTRAWRAARVQSSKFRVHNSSEGQAGFLLNCEL